MNDRSEIRNAFVLAVLITGALFGGSYLSAKVTAAKPSIEVVEPLVIDGIVRNEHPNLILFGEGQKCLALEHYQNGYTYQARLAFKRNGDYAEAEKQVGNAVRIEGVIANRGAEVWLIVESVRGRK